jgi:hypothetical protein
MSSEEQSRPVDHASIDEYRQHAAFRAGHNPSGIGAAVVGAGFRAGNHVWECIISDGTEWHYVEVVGAGIGEFSELPEDEIEAGIERFAAGLAPEYRLRAVLNASPLRIDSRGHVGD